VRWKKLSRRFWRHKQFELYNKILQRLSIKPLQDFLFDGIDSVRDGKNSGKGKSGGNSRCRGIFCGGGF
jgi:hypothetical protein